jgi:hypothetical protein
MSTQARITTGPDLARIISRLTDGNSVGAGDERQRPVMFKVTDGAEEWEEHIFLQGMSREDGSGKNWILEGYNKANGCQVKIFYTLHNRTGTMEFVKSIKWRDIPSR